MDDFVKIPTEIIPLQNKQVAQIALQQASFQAEQQKLNSQLALQLAQLTAKESKQNV